MNKPVMTVPKPFLIAASGVYVAELVPTVPLVPVPALSPRVMTSVCVGAFQVIVDSSADVDPENVTVPPVTKPVDPSVTVPKRKVHDALVTVSVSLATPPSLSDHRHVTERLEALVGEVTAPNRAHGRHPERL